MNIARQLGSQVLLRSRIQHVCGTRQIIARSIFGLGDGSGDDGTSGNGVAVVTKRDIAAEIAETHELSYAKSQRIVNTVFDVITEAVIDEKQVSISKFGSFEKVDRKEREGYNPSTGESMTIPASKRIRFRSFTALKDAANGKA